MKVDRKAFRAWVESEAGGIKSAVVYTGEPTQVSVRVSDRLIRVAVNPGKIRSENTLGEVKGFIRKALGGCAALNKLHGEVGDDIIKV